MAHFNKTESENASILTFRNLDLKTIELEYLMQVIYPDYQEIIIKYSPFSINKNSVLSDEAMRNVIRFLPKSILEIGLVGCGLKNEAARLTSHWLRKNPKAK
jgi:hypothetical protein